VKGHLSGVPIWSSDLRRHDRRSARYGLGEVRRSLNGSRTKMKLPDGRTTKVWRGRCWIVITDGRSVWQALRRERRRPTGCGMERRSFSESERNARMCLLQSGGFIGTVDGVITNQSWGYRVVALCEGSLSRTTGFTGTRYVRKGLPHRNSVQRNLDCLEEYLCRH
jgi:hypothetical protein